MTQVKKSPETQFLSDLYAQDAPQARLLAEYPSSNSQETMLRNESKYLIHDPFPPPRRELLKVLGPHHLMCCWGQQLAVTSEIAPPDQLLAHWENTFGGDSRPQWKPLDRESEYVTLFPHESLDNSQQAIDPDINYAIHSKEVIAEIDCPQAQVLDSVCPPCIVKLSHGYAGLGNFLILSASDEAAMRDQLKHHWPNPTLVINSVIENITGDFGVQFYLGREGSKTWLGFTEQQFDAKQRWSGGTFSASLQEPMFDSAAPFIDAVGSYLHERGYFGLVGIDILRDSSEQLFLVDVNPRLTGISPFLMASRIFARDGLPEGIYQASCQFPGSAEQLIEAAEQTTGARVVVLSFHEETNASNETSTRCHLAVTSESQDHNQKILYSLLQESRAH